MGEGSVPPRTGAAGVASAVVSSAAHGTATEGEGCGGEVAVALSRCAFDSAAGGALVGLRWADSTAGAARAIPSASA